MLWKDLLKGVTIIASRGHAVDVRGVQYDSRRIHPGDVFIAIAGATWDGNQFVEAALERGASGIITDSQAGYDALLRRQPTLPAALVQRGRRAMAEVSASVFGHPEKRLAVSAITGTNGKTTTAYLLEQMLRGAGRTCVLIGTIETHIGAEVKVSEHTTPEARDLLALFADGVRVGATEAVMEMSSHALEQERVWGIPVDVAIFTNLTQDHLDYHATMADYFAAKTRLFTGVGTEAPRVAVIHGDDSYGARLIQVAGTAGSEVMVYGLSNQCAYRAEQLSMQAGESIFKLVTPHGWMPIRSPLTGRVNVENLLASACAALARGLSLAQIADGAKSLRQVPGRFQVVPAKETGVTVVVDYAHTDDALRNLIVLARELVSATGGRVITVFGCGGDRDRGKRPKMGRVAATGSDLVVVTSDNPRTEDPIAIIEEILSGIGRTAATVIVEEDRAGAIRIAVRAAVRGDMVLIAGKGHEKTQTFADGVVPFDDVAEAAEALADMASS